MNYFSLTYPNNTTLILKAVADLNGMVTLLAKHSGIKAPSGTIYNTQSFLTLSQITAPDQRQQLVAQELIGSLI